MSAPHAACEQVLVIQGDLPTPMLGVLSLPGHGAPAPTSAVVIVNGGAQYRAGAHRLFVLLARHLAAHGHAVLRFDLPGQGDSPGEPVHFEDTAPHIGAAIDAVLARHPSVRGVVLWGLCDGASASLLYLQATQDARVAGVAMLNPWVQSETSLARAEVKHYYRQRLADPRFWRKLFLGHVGWASLQGFWQSLLRMQIGQGARENGSNGFSERMALALAEREIPTLVLLSEKDLTAQTFLEHTSTHARWIGQLQKPSVTLHKMTGADHTCSTPGSQVQALARTLDWLKKFY